MIRDADPLMSTTMISPVSLKTCRECGVSKPRSEFRADPTAPDGYRSTCRTCGRASNIPHTAPGSMNALHSAAIRIYPSDEAIFVTPEHLTQRWVPEASEMIPYVGVHEWEPAGDGLFRPIIRLHNPMVRLTEASKATGVPYRMLWKLVTAGFCRGEQVTPGNLMIDLHSYYEHLKECEDAEFWSEARRKQYRDAL